MNINLAIIENCSVYALTKKQVTGDNTICLVFVLLKINLIRLNKGFERVQMWWVDVIVIQIIETANEH